MTGESIINEFMITFLDLINSGFGLISGDVNWMFTALLIISITLTGIFWAFGERDSLGPLFRKVLLVGFFAFLLNGWIDLTDTVAQSFIALGLKAGGNTMSVAEFLDPGAIVLVGTGIFAQLVDQARSLTGIVDTFENIVEITILLLSGLVVIVSFFIIAIQIFVTILTFKLATLAAFVLLPFGVLKQTNFATERALGYVLSAGVRLLVLGLVVSIGAQLYTSFALGDPPTIADALGATLGAATLLFLALNAPSVASDLITGGPSLGAGAGLGAAAGTAAIMGGGALLAARGGLALGQATGSSLSQVKAAVAISGMEGIAGGATRGAIGGSSGGPQAQLPPPPGRLSPPGGGTPSPRPGGGGGGSLPGGGSIETTPMSSHGAPRGGTVGGQQASQSGSIFDGFKPENIGKSGPNNPIYDRGPAPTTGTSKAVLAAIMAARAVRPNDGGGGMAASGSISEDQS